MNGHRSQPFDYESYRRACASFATGITVTTLIGKDGSPQGLTANSFSSISWDPPLVMVCVDVRASVHEHFLECKAFAINILADDQREESALFSTPGVDRFSGTEWEPGELGVPVLRGALGVLECTMHQAVPAGDHTIFLGEVKRAASREGRPLLYFNSSYRDLA